MQINTEEHCNGNLNKLEADFSERTYFIFVGICTHLNKLKIVIMYIICSKLRRKKSLSQSALVVCLAIMLYQIQVLQAKGARNEPAQFTPTESDYHLVAHECKRRLVDTKNGYTIVFKEDKIFGQRNSEHEHS